jgi:hypothetical protein
MWLLYTEHEPFYKSLQDSSILPQPELLSLPSLEPWWWAAQQTDSPADRALEKSHCNATSHRYIASSLFVIPSQDLACPQPSSSYSMLTDSYGTALAQLLSLHYCTSHILEIDHPPWGGEEDDDHDE